MPRTCTRGEECVFVQYTLDIRISSRGSGGHSYRNICSDPYVNTAHSSRALMADPFINILVKCRGNYERLV